MNPGSVCERDVENFETAVFSAIGAVIKFYEWLIKERTKIAERAIKERNGFSSGMSAGKDRSSGLTSIVRLKTKIRKLADTTVINWIYSANARGLVRPNLGFTFNEIISNSDLSFQAKTFFDFGPSFRLFHIENGFKEQLLTFYGTRRHTGVSGKPFHERVYEALLVKMNNVHLSLPPRLVRKYFDVELFGTEMNTTVNFLAPFPSVSLGNKNSSGGTCLGSFFTWYPDVDDFFTSGSDFLQEYLSPPGSNPTSPPKESVFMTFFEKEAPPPSLNPKDLQIKLQAAEAPMELDQDSNLEFPTSEDSPMEEETYNHETGEIRFQKSSLRDLIIRYRAEEEVHDRYIGMMIPSSESSETSLNNSPQSDSSQLIRKQVLSPPLSPREHRVFRTNSDPGMNPYKPRILFPELGAEASEATGQFSLKVSSSGTIFPSPGHSLSKSYRRKNSIPETNDSFSFSGNQDFKPDQINLFTLLERKQQSRSKEPNEQQVFLANPPFDNEIISLTADRIEKIMNPSITIIVVIPIWDKQTKKEFGVMVDNNDPDCAGFEKMLKSKWLFEKKTTNMFKHRFYSYGTREYYSASNCHVLLFRKGPGQIELDKFLSDWEAEGPSRSFLHFNFNGETHSIEYQNEDFKNGLLYGYELLKKEKYNINLKSVEIITQAFRGHKVKLNTHLGTIEVNSKKMFGQGAAVLIKRCLNVGGKDAYGLINQYCSEL